MWPDGKHKSNDRAKRHQRRFGKKRAVESPLGCLPTAYFLEKKRIFDMRRNWPREISKASVVYYFFLSNTPEPLAPRAAPREDTGIGSADVSGTAR